MHLLNYKVAQKKGAMPLERHHPQNLTALIMKNNSEKVNTPIYLPKADLTAFVEKAKEISFKPADSEQVVLETASKLTACFNSIEAVLHDLAQGIRPYLILGNMPIDEQLPAPPKDGKRPENKQTWVSEMTLLAIALLAGLLPFGYKKEKSTLIREIAPIINKEETRSSGGRLDMGFHTDFAIGKKPYRPELVFLLGLINKPETPTYIALLAEALQELSSRDQRILQEPLFRVQLPPLFHFGNGEVLLSELRPLLTLDGNGVAEIAVNLDTVKTENREAQTALNALSDLLPHVAQEIVLHPGYLLLFNNAKCLHARAALPKVGDRWLQRLLCRRSLADLRSASGDDSTLIFDIESFIFK